MEILVDRDSVAAGDDVDRHDIRFEVDALERLGTAVGRLLAQPYLAGIGSDDGATWLLRAGGNDGAVLAVLHQVWERWEPIHWFHDPQVLVGAAGPRWYFTYRRQIPLSDEVRHWRP